MRFSHLQLDAAPPQVGEAVLDNIVWIVIGAVLTLLVEWVVRGGVSAIGARFMKWWAGPASGPFDDVLVLVRPGKDQSESHYRILNAGTRTYRNMTISASHEDHSGLVGFSPYADGLASIAERDVLRPDATILIPRSYLDDQRVSLRWRATFDESCWARTLIDRVMRKRRETFGTLNLQHAVGPMKPLQNQILLDVRRMFGLAPGYPKTPDAAVEAALLAVSDEQASRILRSKRTYDDPAPGVMLPERTGR